MAILSSQKNSPRHSPILEEKPRRNKYIFGANTKYNGDNCHFFIKTFVFLFSYLLFSINL